MGRPIDVSAWSTAITVHLEKGPTPSAARLLYLGGAANGASVERKLGRRLMPLQGGPHCSGARLYRELFEGDPPKSPCATVCMPSGGTGSHLTGSRLLSARKHHLAW